MNYSSEHIPAHIDSYIKSNDTTKSILASKLGISRATFYEKLNGSSRWSLDEAIDLAGIMGCDLVDILVPPSD